MRYVLALVMSLVAVAGLASSESPTAVAKEHATKACEAVWANAAPVKIERCVTRTMAALGRDEQLRYNDLARRHIDTGKELESCKADLSQLRSEQTGTKVSRKN